MSFNEKMEKIDEIVKKIEKEQLPLEEALGLFQEGIGLIRECQTFLKDTEQKITILSSDGDEAPFTNNDSEKTEGN
jgi:exodeoxyribonuclease VII small subunit